MSWDVPLTDLRLTDDDVEAVLDCLRGGWLTMGPRTRRFEAALQEWVGAEHAVALSSGTAALHLACAAAGVGPGDEVIVPALTFLASAHAPRYCGAEPVFCDVASPTEPLLDVAAVERCITPRTKAVIAVHFCGYAADVVALRALCDAHGLVLIEDAAQAIGATVAPGGPQAGTVGHLGCFSFFSKKQLSVGEGGMVATGDEALADRVRSLRSHAMTSGTWDRHRGHEDSYDIVDIGFNFRMDEPRAALGLSRLPRLREEIDARRAAVRLYRERLAGVHGLELCWSDPAVDLASHFAFPVLSADEERCLALRYGLAARGVQTTRYPALHSLSEYRAFAPMGSLPNAEATARRHCALPLSAHTSVETVDTVVAAVRDVLAA
jgi:dTDP-4-amino-4,6-dideoxygalactose transaminase